MKWNRNAIVALVGLLFTAASAPTARASIYALDDGTSEGGVQLGPGTSVIFLNQFPVTAGNNVINSVMIAYGGPGSNPALVGHPVTVVLYEDPDGGNTQNAILKWS